MVEKLGGDDRVPLSEPATDRTLLKDSARGALIAPRVVDETPLTHVRFFSNDEEDHASRKSVGHYEHDVQK